MGVQDTEVVRSLVRRGVRRLRLARALRGAVALGIPAALLLAAVRLLERLRGLPPDGMQWALAAACSLPCVGAAWGLLLPVDRRRVATSIDGASGLHDRLGTAWATTRGLTVEPPPGFPEAAVRDAVRSSGLADVAAALPIRLPATTRALLLSLVALSAAAFVRFPEPASGLSPLAPRQAQPLADLDELEAQRQVAVSLKEEAKQHRDERLARVADEMARLVDRMERGEVDRKGAFERIHALENKLREGAEEVAAAERAAEEAVAEAAKELQRREETRELGDALAKGDLEAAETALRKLADLLERAPMSRSLLSKLAEIFGKSAQELAKRFDARMARELQDEMKRLRELMRKQGLSEREKERLDELERKLSELKPQEQKGGGQGESPQRAPGQSKPDDKQAGSKPADEADQQQQGRAGMSRMVNRLSRRMEQLAKDLRAGADGPSQAQDKAGEEARKGAEEIRNLHRAMREQQARRRAQQKLSDLKESMRRSGSRRRAEQQSRGFRQRAEAGERPGQAPGDQEAQRAARAAGRKGQELRRSGEGGTEPGHEPDRGAGQGKASKTGGRYKEQFVEGKERDGPVLEEVILDAAQKGFAQTGYRDAFVRYRDVAEEELARERVPAGYRYHVKRYFDLIRPHEAGDGGE